MMKGTTSTDVGYSGEVRIYLKSNDNMKEVYVHNEGKKALWNLLARAVAGYDVKNLLPRYLDLVNETSGLSMLYKRIPFTGIIWGDSVEKDETGTSTLFNATLTSEYKTKSISNSKIELRMLNSNNDVLASVSGGTGILDVYNSVVPGVDAVIEWKLTFKNYTTDKE